MRAKLGESYQRTSAVFIWATIQRLYGARKSGLKKEMFGYVPGGYKTIIEAFEKKLQEEQIIVKTGCAVKKVSNSPEAKPAISFADGSTEEFDEVIITLPSGIAAQLCSGITGDEKDKLMNIEYLGVICVAVLLDKPVSNFYITNITDSSVPFTGVIEMSSLVDKKYFKGHSLVYLPKYVSSEDPMFNSPEEEIRNYFISNFKKMYSRISDENIKFAGVARARHVITVAKLNYSELLPGIRTSMTGVSIVNTSHIKDGTLNVNETIRVAETKLKVLLSLNEKEKNTRMHLFGPG